MYVALDDITVNYGDTVILEDITANINQSDMIGLIGANGAGKTTLLNTIVKRLPAEKGSVAHKSDLKIGYLEQNSGLTKGNSIIEEMRSVFGEVLRAGERMRELEKLMKNHDKQISQEYTRVLEFFESKDGYNIEVQIKKILNGMGFSDKSYEMSIDALSGGEKTRLAIAKLLLENPDLLILDEPTNHLDFKTLVWLEEYLSGYKGAIIIVSHDRYFLDKVAQKIWEIEDKQLTEYKGNYTQYKQLKADYVSYMTKEFVKQERQIEHMQDYVAKNLARASTSSSAKSRVKQLARIEKIKKPNTMVKTPSLQFVFDKNSVVDVLDVKNLELAVGQERMVLVKDISFDVKRSEKIAVIGDNGTGKSTLLKSLLHMIDTSNGEIVWGKNTDIGYYDQENKNMTPEKTVLNEIWDKFPSLLEYGARGMLGRVLLTGENVFKQVKSLSGGERAKLGLAILMCGKHNVLLLDEPTNHLDLPARESLEQALKDYEGTLLFVSHDRYFVNALANKVFEIAGDGFHRYEGGFDDYIAQKAAIVPQTQTTEKISREKTTNKKQKRSDEAKRRSRIGELEKLIADVEQEETELTKQIAQNPSDYELLSKNCVRIEELKVLHEQYLQEWMEAAE
ncbi:MAG: ABC-F family ATP-binding cassette domain-containing protein [Christensenellaceae bacterium]